MIIARCIFGTLSKPTSLLVGHAKTHNLISGKSLINYCLTGNVYFTFGWELHA
tara:strand:+ start:690 stop:848 length:159 start_codon:yes stop_codon:yes gene_type:complete